MSEITIADTFTFHGESKDCWQTIANTFVILKNIKMANNNHWLCYSEEAKTDWKVLEIDDNVTLKNLQMSNSYWMLVALLKLKNIE